MVERILPQNINAEMSVLGSIIKEGKLIYEVIGLITENDFYKTAHRVIYRAMLKMMNENTEIDLVTLTAELRQEKELSNTGNVYLNTCMESVATTANIQYYINVVKEQSLLRRLIIASQNIYELAYKGKEIKEIVNQSQEIMFNCFKDEYNKEMRFYSLPDLLHDSFTYIEDMQSKKGFGIKTTFTDLDNLIGGLQKKELYVIAGDTSQGKSSFAMDIAYNVANQGIPVAFFSIEMGKENLIQRLLCSRAKVDFLKMKAGYLSDEDWARLTTAAGKLSEIPIFINDFSTPTAIEIIGMAKKVILHKGVKLIIIDFLQQIYHSDKDSETKQVTTDVKLIKGLAMSCNIPVILLSSLSRRANYKEPPTLSLLRQSGAIESAADTVMFVYRQEEYMATEENQGIAEIYIRKQRNGPTGICKLAFIKHYTRFENLDRRGENNG